MIDSPIATDSITNKQATQEASIYHTCRSVLNELSYVEGFEAYLKEDDLSDPLTRLWNICQPGVSLCFLFNSLDSITPIDLDDKQTKQYIYHYIVACNVQLHIPEASLFTITELYEYNSNGLIKVVNTIKHILELLKEQGKIPEQAFTEIEAKHVSPKDLRDNVVYELVSTERKYVQDLEALQNYMKEAKHLLSADTMHYLFGNLNTLVDVQRRFLIQVEEQAASASQEQRFGLLFQQFEESFQVYEPFCSNFQIAQELVVQIAYKLQKLDNLMSSTYELPAMLIKPIQRVCKYPLLLQQLIKATPEDWTYSEENKEGLEAIQRVTKKVNETKRVQENNQAAKELKKKLVVDDGAEIVLDKYGPLLLHDRFILQKSESDHTKESVVYLFQKLILICKEVKDSNKNSITIKKKRKEGSLIIKGKINMARVDHVKSSSSTTGNYAFMIHWSEKDVRQKIQLKCRNDEQLRQWLDVIIATKKETKGPTVQKLEPATPLSEFAPILESYDDDGDDDLYHAQSKPALEEEPVTDPNSFVRNRFYSYQYNRSPHHTLHEPVNRKQSLGNPLLPRHYGLNPPPLPTPTSELHSLPYSPPTSNPSSPHHPIPTGPAWPKRQDPIDEPVRRDKLASTSKRNSQEQDDYIKIKTHHKGGIYVIRVPAHIDYEELSRRIQDKLKLSGPTESIEIAGLKYEDEDGDLITINSTEDVQMGFEIKGPNNVVNFHVTTVC